MVAHLILGSPLWSVRVESQSTRNDAIAESVETSPGEAFFDSKRRKAIEALGLSPDEQTLVGGTHSFAGLLIRLMAMPDDAVMDLVALTMGETLSAGSVAVEFIGLQLGIDMADWWQPDDILFALIRDRGLLLEMTSDVAGPVIAKANASEKSKALKQIMRNHLDGAEGRPRHDRWVPRWMQFPPTAYTDRGGVAMIAAHARALESTAAVKEDEGTLAA